MRRPSTDDGGGGTGPGTQGRALGRAGSASAATGIGPDGTLPLVRLDGGPQAIHRPVEPRVDRAHRHAEHLRGAFEREPELVVEGHDGAVRHGQAGQRPLDDLMVGDQVVRVVMDRPDVDGRDREVAGRPRRADLGVARVHDEPVRPCIEPADIAQGGQVAPDADERPLDRLVGEVMVPEDRHGHATQPPGRRVDERRERDLVTPLGPDHGRRVHGRHPRP